MVSAAVSGLSTCTARKIRVVRKTRPTGEPTNLEDVNTMAPVLPSLGCYRVRVKAVLLIQHCGGATGTCGTWFSNIASKIMGIGPGGVCIILISDDLIVSFARDLKR